MKELLDAVYMLKDASPVLSLLLVGAALIAYAWNERRSKGIPNGGHPEVKILRAALDTHVERTASHFGVVESRIAENYEEFLKFQTEVYRELATKDDLMKMERAIKEHVTMAMRRRG